MIHKKHIFVFGNQDLESDSLPLRILPKLKQRFPEIEFEIKDPNEEWSAADKKITLLDTMSGITKLTIYDGLENFADSPRLTMHDFDALANLKLLQKLGKIDSVKIIGIPPALSENEALNQITAILNSI